LVLYLPESDVDHINRNKFDNRKSNLRSVSRSINCQNTHKRKNVSSNYKGVSWKSSHNCWVCSITKNRKTKFLGHFKTEEEAAAASVGVKPRKRRAAREGGGAEPRPPKA
jgi:hypothetical protein